jgi:hypothetical protein
VVHKAAVRKALLRMVGPTAGDKAVVGKDTGMPAGMVKEFQARVPVGGTVVRLLQVPRDKVRRAGGIVLPKGVEHRDNWADTGNRGTDSLGEEDPKGGERRAAVEPPAAVALPLPRLGPESVRAPGLVLSPEERRAAAASRQRVGPVLVLEPGRSVSASAPLVARVSAHQGPAAGESPRRQARKAQLLHRMWSRSCGSHRSRSRTRDTRRSSNISSMWRLPVLYYSESTPSR